MALDFYDVTDCDREKKLFSLLQKDYLQVSQIFEMFEQRTGVFVDPYGTTRLYSNNIGLLVELIGRCLSEEVCKNVDFELIKRLQMFLSNAFQKGHTLIIEGD